MIERSDSFFITPILALRKNITCPHEMEKSPLNVINDIKVKQDLFIKHKEYLQNTKIGFHTPFYTPSEIEFIHIPKCAGTSLSKALRRCPSFGGDFHRPLAYQDYISIMSGGGRN